MFTSFFLFLVKNLYVIRYVILIITLLCLYKLLTNFCCLDVKQKLSTGKLEYVPRSRLSREVLFPYQTFVIGSRYGDVQLTLKMQLKHERVGVSNFICEKIGVEGL